MARKKRDTHIIDDETIRQNATSEAHATFAIRFNHLLIDNEISQLELAKALNLSVGQISKFRNGLAMPRANTLVEICEILHTSADYLLGLTNIKYAGLDMELLSKRAGLSANAIVNLMLLNANVVETTQFPEETPKEEWIANIPFMSPNPTSPKTPEDLTIKALNTLLESQYLGHFLIALSAIMSDDVKIAEGLIPVSIDGIKLKMDSNILPAIFSSDLAWVIDRIKENKDKPFELPFAKGEYLSWLIQKLLKTGNNASFGPWEEENEKRKKRQQQWYRED